MQRLSLLMLCSVFATVAILGVEIQAQKHEIVRPSNYQSPNLTASAELQAALDRSVSEVLHSYSGSFKSEEIAACSSTDAIKFGD